jgi:hypothetical protein
MGGRATPHNARRIGLFLRGQALAVFWWTEFRVQQQICCGRLSEWSVH